MLHDGLQIIPLGVSNVTRYRSCTYDPQTSIRQDQPIRIPTIYSARWIIVSANGINLSYYKLCDTAILLHGGSPNGAELIVAKWTDTRGVNQVVFKPDWKSNCRSAPFKRNDKLLATMPQGLIATPGTGITENLVDKARKLGIRILRVS